MTRSTDMLYQVQLAVLNVEESIERHANLALAQIQVEAQRAYLHIHNMLERYKAEDQFSNRSRGQRRRYALQRGNAK